MNSRSSRIVIAIVALALTLAAAACTGGGGSGSDHAPQLSGMYSSPNSVDQYSGNGSVDIYVSFDYFDAGGDLVSLTLTVYDGLGNKIGSETETIQGGSGITSGYISGTIPADTNVAGNYTFELYATDSAGAHSDKASFTLTVVPKARLLSIDVTPANPTILKQDSQQFTATASYDDGTQLNVTTICSWVSSDSTVAIVGWMGLAIGSSGGTSTITALYGGGSGSTTLTVADVPLVSLAVTPQSPSIDKDATLQLTAMGTYANSMTRNITSSVTWSSSNQNVATVDGRGLVTGLSAGSTTISASTGTLLDRSTVSVLADFGTATGYPGTYFDFLGNTAIGDLNGDGRNDVAAIEGYNSRNRIAVYYQNADHTLGAQQIITTDLSLRGVAIADINNDGLAELIIVGNATSGASPLGRVYIYAQDPETHALKAPQQHTISTDSVVGLAVADLNNDGLPDIVVTGADWMNPAVVSFLFQGSSGTLASEATYTGVTVYGGGEIHVADMSNDGMNDIVLQSGAKKLAVIKQISPGQFSATPDYYTVQTSYWSDFRSFALGDLNGDGKTDIAVADMGNSSLLNIFLQDDSGHLTGPSVQTVSYSGQDEIHIADVNGDGLKDIIMITGGCDVEIMHQTAEHTFHAMIDYGLPTSTSGGTHIHQAISIGDVTGDGVPDIVTTWDESLYVLPHAQ